MGFLTEVSKANSNELLDYEVYLTAQIEHHQQILSSSSFRNRQLQCLARNIYYEARGERVVGQLAVANVTMNRTTNNNICQTVYKRNQFSWTRHRQRNPTGQPWLKAQVLAWLVLRQPEMIIDVTENSEYFHSGRIRPRDFHNFTRTVIIGNHRFYRENTEIAEGD